MKKLISLILFLLFFDCCKAADSLTTTFINSIYHEVVDNQAKYYYLFQVGKNPAFERGLLKDQFEENKDILRDVPIDDFLCAIESDTDKVNWNTYTLLNARCVDKMHFPNYTPDYGSRIIRTIFPNTSKADIKRWTEQGQILVLVRNGMTKKQIAKAEREALGKYENRPIEEKTVYSFSKPVFSKNKKYALIGLNGHDRGALYIFKMTGEKWVKILEFDRWVV